MILGIIGNTDKRLLILSLMKVLAHRGDVALITPTNQYKRLIIEHGTDLGYLENNLIAVTQYSTDEVWEAINQTPQDFDFVIYDLENNIADNVDTYIHVRGNNLDETEEDFLSEISDLNVKQVKFSYDGKRDPDKEVFNIRVTMKDIIFIEKTESIRELYPMHNPGIAKLIHSVVGDKLGISHKTISSLLKGGKAK